MSRDSHERVDGSEAYGAISNCGLRIGAAADELHAWITGAARTAGQADAGFLTTVPGTRMQFNVRTYPRGCWKCRTYRRLLRRGRHWNCMPA